MAVADHAIGELPVSSVRRLRMLADGVASAECAFGFAIFAATHEFATLPTDAKPNVPFFGTLTKPLRVERSILDGRGIGGVQTTYGELELINADGTYDNVVDRFSIDGRSVIVKVGFIDAAYDTFFAVYAGTASSWHVDEDVLRITLRDNSYKLEVPAQPNTYAGTGGVEGGEDLVGKRKPRSFGTAYNVSPPLLNTDLVYQVNDGPIQAIQFVLDRGANLTPSGDFANSGLLVGAVIAAGSYATCLAEGLFRLGALPDGLVTATVEGDNSDGWLETTVDIVRSLVLTTAGIVDDPATLDSASLDDLDLAQPAGVGYWLDPDSEATVGDVVDDLMRGIAGFAGFLRDGRFSVGRFTAPAGPALISFDSRDIIAITREPLPSGLNPPPWRYRVAWGRNWTVQTTDLAGSVASTVVGYLAEEVRVAISTDTATSDIIRASHPLAQDPEIVQAYFTIELDAETEADRLLALYGPVTAAIYRIRFKLQPFVLDIDDVIEVTYPRWDLSAGRMLRIVAFSEDAEERSVEIRAYG